MCLHSRFSFVPLVKLMARELFSNDEAHLPYTVKGALRDYSRITISVFLPAYRMHFHSSCIIFLYP